MRAMHLGGPLKILAQPEEALHVWLGPQGFFRDPESTSGGIPK